MYYSGPNHFIYIPMAGKLSFSQKARKQNKPEKYGRN
jgi:hypothetical protein